MCALIEANDEECHDLIGSWFDFRAHKLERNFWYDFRPIIRHLWVLISICSRAAQQEREREANLKASIDLKSFCVYVVSHSIWKCSAVHNHKSFAFITLSLTHSVEISGSLYLYVSPSFWRKSSEVNNYTDPIIAFVAI